MKKISIIYLTAVALMGAGISVVETRAEGGSFFAEQDVKANKGFLAALYNAQIGLHKENKAESSKYLDEALGYVDGLRSSTKNIQNADKVQYGNRRAVELQFGSVILPETAVMPVFDNKMTVESLKDDLKIDGVERGTIRDAEVKYLRFDVDKQDIREQLLEAKKEVGKGDFTGAAVDVRQIQRDMLEDNEDSVSARVRALDHITLTRYLVSMAEYDAARESLKSAEDALGDLKDETEDRVVISRIKGEVKGLEQTIAKRDPSLMDKIDKTLGKWFDELS